MTSLPEDDTLARRIAKRSPFPLSEALGLVSRMCDALGPSHATRIAHGMLDPACVMFLADGRVRISGFDAARSGTGAVDLDRSFGRLPHYRAPEQIRGESPDPRTDVFALGVILYQLLTGQLPFPGESIHAVAHRILAEPPIEPGPPGRVPAPLRRLLLDRALRKSPEERPCGAAELGEELRAAAREAGIRLDLHGAAAGARPPGASPPDPPRGDSVFPGARFGAAPRPRPRSRGRAVLGAVTVGACLVVTGATVVYFAFLARGPALREGSTPRLASGGEQGAGAPPPPPPGRGRTVHVVADPAASLFLDGKLLSGPAFRLLPGDERPHRLRAESGCRSAEAEIPAGFDRADVSLSLAPERARLPVQTHPPGATVTVNGRAVAGKTPLSIEIDRCAAHRVEIALAGYTTLEYRLTPGEGVAPLAVALAAVSLEKQRSRKPGTIRVAGGPYGGDVFVDGRRMGQAGESFTVPAGRHRIALISDRLLVRIESEVRTQPGEETVWRPSWPSLGSLSVRTTPPTGCTIEIRPRRESSFRHLDVAPIVRSRLAAGTYTVRATLKSTSQVQEREVEVLPGTNVPIAFNFLR